MVYLDNAATSWPKPEEVYCAVDSCLRSLCGSPGRGGHQKAMATAQLLYDAREALATLFNIVDPTTIAFSSNATAAMNTALFGLLQTGMHVITSSMEHNAVARPLHELAQAGVKLTIVPCDSMGQIDVEQLAAVMAAGATAVVLAHASNVTGTLQPLREIGKLAAEHKTLLIVDAAQTAGVQEINVIDMGIDILVFSGHKGLWGPPGTGGLYVKPEVKVKPLLFGGTGSLSESVEQPAFMPDALESGTPNTPGIAGLLAGVQCIGKVG